MAYANCFSNDVVLIITGCIKPRKDQRFLVLKDEYERLRQYVDSIVYYIENSPFSVVVFCDNSGYHYDGIGELVALANSCGKSFEWLSFYGDHERIAQCGKGYGEGEIIQYALSHSKYIEKSKYFAKVTGRLIIENIGRVVKDIEYDCSYFNRDIYRGHGIDTRFYLCEISFYEQYLSKLHEQTCELPGREKAIEDIFWTVLRGNRKCRNLMAYPAFKGCSGGNGRDYSQIPQRVITLYSLLCRFNVFNECYAVILGFKKLYLILTGQLTSNVWRRK